jgi:hypothetical protein
MVHPTAVVSPFWARNGGAEDFAVLLYRGFIPKGDRVLSYNIIVVPKPP